MPITCPLHQFLPGNSRKAGSPASDCTVLNAMRDGIHGNGAALVTSPSHYCWFMSNPLQDFTVDPAANKPPPHCKHSW